MSVELLEVAAKALSPLATNVVFVGGATINVWLDDPAIPSVRPTNDVDVICEVATRRDYDALETRLRKLGFRNDHDVLCRWCLPDSDLKIDVMPLVEEILGFSNAWYGRAMRTAVEKELPSGQRIWVASPTTLIATKLAAWENRGAGDVMQSKDVHDMFALIDGRLAIVHEIREEDDEVRSFVCDSLRRLLDEPYADYALEGSLANYGSVGEARAERLRARLRELLAR